MRSAIVARVSDRNRMEVADDLGHGCGDYYGLADDSGVDRHNGVYRDTEPQADVSTETSRIATCRLL